PAGAPAETRRRGSAARSEPPRLPLLPSGKRKPAGPAARHAPLPPRPLWGRSASVPRDVLKRPLPLAAEALRWLPVLAAASPRVPRAALLCLRRPLPPLRPPPPPPPP